MSKAPSKFLRSPPPVNPINILSKAADKILHPNARNLLKIWHGSLPEFPSTLFHGPLEKYLTADFDQQKPLCIMPQYFSSTPRPPKDRKQYGDLKGIHKYANQMIAANIQYPNLFESEVEFREFLLEKRLRGELDQMPREEWRNQFLEYRPGKELTLPSIEDPAALAKKKVCVFLPLHQCEGKRAVQAVSDIKEIIQTTASLLKVAKKDIVVFYEPGSMQESFIDNNMLYLDRHRIGSVAKSVAERLMAGREAAKHPLILFGISQGGRRAQEVGNAIEAYIADGKTKSDYLVADEIYRSVMSISFLSPFVASTKDRASLHLGVASITDHGNAKPINMFADCLRKEFLDNTISYFRDADGKLQYFMLTGLHAVPPSLQRGSKKEIPDPVGHSFINFAREFSRDIEKLGPFQNMTSLFLKGDISRLNADIRAAFSGLPTLNDLKNDCIAEKEMQENLFKSVSEFASRISYNKDRIAKDTDQKYTPYSIRREGLAYAERLDRKKQKAVEGIGGV